MGQKALERLEVVFEDELVLTDFVVTGLLDDDVLALNLYLVDVTPDEIHLVNVNLGPTILTV